MAAWIWKKDLPTSYLEVRAGNGGLFVYGAGSIYDERMKAVIV